MVEAQASIPDHMIMFTTGPIVFQLRADFSFEDTDQQN